MSLPRTPDPFGGLEVGRGVAWLRRVFRWRFATKKKNGRPKERLFTSTPRPIRQYIGVATFDVHSPLASTHTRLAGLRFIYVYMPGLFSGTAVYECVVCIQPEYRHVALLHLWQGQACEPLRRA